MNNLWLGMIVGFVVVMAAASGVVWILAAKTHCQNEVAKDSLAISEQLKEKSISLQDAEARYIELREKLDGC